MKVLDEATIGSKESQRACLNYVLRHPVAFREYFVPQVSKRSYWHRYMFSPVLLAQCDGDTEFAAGRASGKSYAVLEPEIVQQSVLRPGEETLLTSFRRTHVVDRMERVIDYFETIPLFRIFVDRITRSPIYNIEMKNGHNIYAASVGDDPEAKMAQGKHASTVIVEEAHQYPERAWMKLQGAKDPRGSRVLMTGVPDGSLDTPFRKAAGKYESFAGRRFHISRRFDPYFDRKTLQHFVDIYGGEDSDVFMQEVDAIWGSPVWSAWDLDAIYRCVLPEAELPLVRMTISGKVYRDNGWGPSTVLADLPTPPLPQATTRISMDVGYSQPSEIGVWKFWHDRWRMVARVSLINRMEHDDQADILEALCDRYNASQIGIDTSEGEGRAIATQLERKYGNRVVRCTMMETFIGSYTPEGEEVTETAREIATRTLRALIAKQTLAFPKDEEIPAQFNQEKESRGADGKIRVMTPTTVHITDMFRVKALLEFFAHPPLPPGMDTEFVEVEWGDDTGGPWSPRSRMLL